MNVSRETGEWVIRCSIAEGVEFGAFMAGEVEMVPKGTRDALRELVGHAEATHRLQWQRCQTLARQKGGPGYEFEPVPPCRETARARALLDAVE